MTPNPTLTVLSSMHRHGVRCLLMGGQACVFYGAAEFSRDVDFAILAEDGNLQRLQAALDELDATVIAVPPFAASYLRSPQEYPDPLLVLTSEEYASAAFEQLLQRISQRIHERQRLEELKTEAARGNRPDFDRFLKAVAAHPPLPGDSNP